MSTAYELPSNYNIFVLCLPALDLYSLINLFARQSYQMILSVQNEFLHSSHAAVLMVVCLIRHSPCTAHIIKLEVSQVDWLMLKSQLIHLNRSIVPEQPEPFARS